MSQTGWINFYNLFAKAQSPEHAKQLEDEWENRSRSSELDELKIGILAEGAMLRIEINDTELYDDPDEELKQLNGWLKKRGVTLNGHVNLEMEGEDYREDFIDGELVTADYSWLGHYDANTITVLRHLAYRMDYCFNEICPTCGGDGVQPHWKFNSEDQVILATYVCDSCGCKFQNTADIEMDNEPTVTADSMKLSDRQLIHIYNRMPGVNKVVINTSDEIKAMFDRDFLEFYNRASKGNYNTDDTWIKLNAHGNLIAFTNIEDSDIDVERVRMWAKEHIEEIKDILENK